MKFAVCFAASLPTTIGSGGFVEAALVLSMHNIQDDLSDVPLPSWRYSIKPRFEIDSGGEEPRRVLAAGVGTAPAEG